MNKERENAEAKARADRQILDAKELQQARAKFNEKLGLGEAVKEKILPSLVMIKTLEGREGMGFFYHSNWLVSNAHVIPHKDYLLGADIVSCDNEMPLIAKQSFHRPNESSADSKQANSKQKISPDIAVIETDIERKSMTCLSHRFSENSGHNETYTFYIDSISEPQIKFLYQLSKPGKYPIIYVQEHNEESNDDSGGPEPGCSGTPIIEARVAVISGKTQWQFRVVGALYARCFANFYNKYMHRIVNISDDSRKLVCAIPIEQEFGHILGILTNTAMAERFTEMAHARQHLINTSHGNPNVGEADQLKAQQDRKSAQYSYDEAAVEFKRYEDGESPLDIELPEGLEKLWVKWKYKDFCKNRISPPKVLPEIKDQTLSRHHIIPLGDLTYLWEFLHNLPDYASDHIRRNAKIDPVIEEEKIKLKKKFNEEFENVDDEEPEEADAKNNPENEAQKKSKEALETYKRQQTNLIESKLNKKIDSKVRQLKEEWKQHHYKSFYLIIPTLCQPFKPQQADNPLQWKRFFVWACWNLFIGFTKSKRSDDPDLREDKSDLSERIKPLSFNSDLWKLLKGTAATNDEADADADSKQPGLFHCIKELKQLPEPKNEEEYKSEVRPCVDKLYLSMEALANFWNEHHKTLSKVSLIHPFNKDDEWEPDPPGQKEKYRLKTP